MCFTKLPILQSCLLQITGLMGGNGLWKGHWKLMGFCNQSAAYSNNSSHSDSSTAHSPPACASSNCQSVFPCRKTQAPPSSHGGTSSPGFISNRHQSLQNSKPDLRIDPASGLPPLLPPSTHFPPTHTRSF